MEEQNAIAIIPTAEQPCKRTLRFWQRGYTASPRSAASLCRRYAEFFAYTRLPLAVITLSDVQGFADSLASLKITSRNRTMAAVKSCLSFAVKTGYLQFNVGAVVKLTKVEDTLAERIMSEAQVARILALETHPRNRVLLSLLYHAGLRAQELCQLQWRHVQPRDDAGQLAIFGKGRKTRFVKLTPPMWKELEGLRPLTVTPEMYVFQSRQAGSAHRSHRAAHR